MNSRATTSAKLSGLELIRFISALAVVLYHYSNFSYLGNVQVALVREQLPFYRYLSVLYDYGNYGVQIFFCISGFIFYFKYADAIADGAISAKRFFVLRFSRLYPLHLATLLLMAGMQWAYFSKFQDFFASTDNDLVHFIKHALMASNWTGEVVTSFNKPSWSISIESAVYILFFVLMTRVGKTFWLNLAMLALYVVAKLAGVGHGIVDGVGYFFAGGLAALIFQASKPRWTEKFVWAYLLLVPLLVLGLQLQSRPHFSHLFLITYVPVLLYAVADIRRAEFFLQKAGDLTYSIYMLHFPIQLCIAFAFRYLVVPVPYTRYSFFFTFFATLLLCSYLVYNYFEAPAKKALRHL